MKNELFLETCIKVYNQVAICRPANDRFGESGEAKVAMCKSGWLRKRYPQDSRKQAWEYQCLEKLQPLDIVPQLETRVGWENGIVIKLCGYGDTLWEYVDGYFRGTVDDANLTELLCQTRLLLETFWGTGWVHGDLHPRNIVPILKGWTGWQLYLIDLATTFRDTSNGRQAFAEYYGVDIQDLGDSARDLEFLKHHLWRIHDRYMGKQIHQGFLTTMGELS